MDSFSKCCGLFTYSVCQVWCLLYVSAQAISPCQRLCNFVSCLGFLDSSAKGLGGQFEQAHTFTFTQDTTVHAMHGNEKTQPYTLAKPIWKFSKEIFKPEIKTIGYASFARRSVSTNTSCNRAVLNTEVQFLLHPSFWSASLPHRIHTNWH